MSPARRLGARPPRREPHHRARRRRQRRAAPPEQAHRLRHLLRRRSPTPRTRRSLAFPIGMAVIERRRDALRRGVRLERGRRLRHGRSSRTTPSCPAGANQIARERRRPDRASCSTRASSGSTCSRASTTRSRSSTPHQGRGRRTCRCTTPSRRASCSGRRFLYDATFSSSHGDSACASCHIFGDIDNLAWDLGNPDDAEQPRPERLRQQQLPQGLPPDEGPDDHAEPARHGQPRPDALARRPHRRGAEPSAQPDCGAFDEDAAFKNFNVAFPGLLGRDAQLPAAEMQAFTDFILRGDLSAEPDPQPRQLAHGAPAARLRPLLRAQDASSIRSSTAIPTAPARSRAATATRSIRTPTRASPPSPASSARNTLSAEVGGRIQTSRPRTCATSTRRSASSASRVSPIWLPSPGQGVFRGEQIRGFGFAHDGSFDTTLTFSFAPNFGKGLADPSRAGDDLPAVPRRPDQQPRGHLGSTPTGCRSTRRSTTT